MFEFLSDPGTWVVALLTLTVLEIVLGIDNIVFISILVGKLPAEQQDRARIIGLSLAMVMRIGLLFTISWIIGLTAPLFEIAGMEISGRDIILLGGGLFLIGKATFEIHDRLEGEEHGASAATAGTATLRVGHRADRGARHRLQPRLGHHRRRHGRGPVGHGRRGRHRRRRDADQLRRDQPAS